MKQCEGQISLMDLITSTATKDVPLILLAEGQTVYKVVRGDIETHIVTGETWICGGDNRGYRLKKADGCWDCTWNTQINKVVFVNLEAARRVVEQYLAENEHILARDIHAIRVVAYRYEYNRRKITNFYSVLENGNVYYCYGSMYEHIGTEAEIKEFEKKRKKFTKYRGYKELKGYQPEYANMYKCPKHGIWLYAAARYGFIG